MLPEEVLAHEPRVLTQEQREFYFANGYLLVEAVVDGDWLERLRAATDEMVDRSRALTRSDRIFDLEPGHTADAPRLRRLTSPVDHHPEYWAFASESVLPDIMADLVGPDVKFHHSKLNFKWAKGGEEVKWHQDITYWPHTNYSPLTAGLYLYDCGPDQGPLMVVPGTHDGELFSQYDDAGRVGRLPVRHRREGRPGRDRRRAHRPGRVDHDPQLPGRPRLPAEPGRRRPAAAAQRVLRRRRLPLHRQPAAEQPRRRHRAGRSRPGGPTTTPGPASCRPTGRGATRPSSPSSSRRSGRTFRVGPERADNGVEGSFSHPPPARSPPCSSASRSARCCCPKA